MERMNYKDIIIKYIDKYDKDEPIFLEDIRKYVLDSNKRYNLQITIDTNKFFEHLNVIINRLVKENYIKNYIKGIYYKPTANIFGEMPLDKSKIIEKKYLKDKFNKINGYITGAKLFNQLGLTTQIPNATTIVTNNCNNKYDYKIEYLNIIIRKADINITEMNYKYLQLIDILLNKEKINIEVNNENEIIRKFIKNNKLDFEKILKYAKETNNRKILDKLFELV